MEDETETAVIQWIIGVNISNIRDAHGFLNAASWMSYMVAAHAVLEPRCPRNGLRGKQESKTFGGPL